MAEIITVPKLVTVFGGSGFVGRHVVRALAKRGYRIRVGCRRPDLAGHLQPLGNLDQIKAVQANVRVPWSIERAMDGADHVINLVGILAEGGRQTFSAVHESGARNVAEAAASAGIGMTQMSALGAGLDSASAYARTKARGEAAVLQVRPEAVIVRPSVIFGPEDQFFNRFAGIARFSPALPLIGGGKTRFQPVFVGDVAEIIARSVDGTVAGGRAYELGGPDVLTFRECMERMLDMIHRKRLLVPVPWSIARLQAAVLGVLPGKLLTPDQVIQLRTDNVVSAGAEDEGRTLTGVGIVPRSIEAIVPTYLWRFRATGQYAPMGGI